MATWFHADRKEVSRGKGKSAVGLASYVTGLNMTDERTGERKFRNHPGDVISFGTVAPADAPAWMTDRRMIEEVWNAVEASELRKNSHTANHWDIALWRHGTPEEHAELMQTMAQAITDRYGVLCTWAVHAPPDHGDGRNSHGHIAHNMRKVDADGFGAKVRETNARFVQGEEVEWTRKMIADVLNTYLQDKGSDEHVTHDSYKDRGLNIAPTIHLGNAVNMMEKQGITTKLGDINRAIMASRQTGSEQGEEEPMAEQPRRYQSLKSPAEIAEHDLKDRATGQEEGNKLHELRMQEERVSAFRREQDAQADEAKKNEKQLREVNEKRAREGELADPRARYMQSVARHYDAKDPYSSLGRAAADEGSMFMRQQSAHKEQEAKLQREGKEEERRQVEFRRQIEANEYMAITSQRMAGIGLAIHGNKNHPDHLRDEKRAQQYQETAVQLKKDKEEHLQLIQNDKQRSERQEVAKSFGSIADHIKAGGFAQEKYNAGREKSDAQQRHEQQGESRIAASEVGRSAERGKGQGMGLGR